MFNIFHSIRRFLSTRFSSNTRPDILVRLPVFLAIMAVIVYLDFSNFYITLPLIFNTVAKDVAILLSISSVVAADIVPCLMGRFSKTNAHKARRNIWIAFLISMIAFIVYLTLSKFFSYDVMFPAEEAEASFSFTQTAVSEPEKISQKTVILRYISLLSQGVVFPFATSVISYSLSVLRAEYTRKKNLEKLLRKHIKLESALLTAESIRENSADPRDLLDEELQIALQNILDMKMQAKIAVREEFTKRFAGNGAAQDYIDSERQAMLEKDGAPAQGEVPETGERA